MSAIPLKEADMTDDTRHFLGVCALLHVFAYVLAIPIGDAIFHHIYPQYF